MSSKTIICYARSYLAHFLPELANHDKENNYLFIVQDNREKKIVEEKGGKVVLNISEEVQHNLSILSEWKEPDDFRALTGFDWSAVFADRYLIHLDEEDQKKVPNIIFNGIKSVLDEYKVDGVLGEPVAIFPTHVLYYFSKKYNFRPLFWLCSYIPGYFCFSEAINPSAPVFRSKELKIPHNINDIVDEFIDGVRLDKKGPVYHYLFAKKQDADLLNKKQRQGSASKVLKPGFRTNLYQILRVGYALYSKLIFKHTGDYMRAASVNEHLGYLKHLLSLKSGYSPIPLEDSGLNVLYPLQYEPEASLLYAAPAFCDQLNNVEMILRSLPSDKILWVKEHPNQYGALSNSKWKALIKKYHNLRFVYGRESGRDLIKKCSLIITVSSSAGVDGLIFNKKTLVLGNCFYQNFDNAVKVESFKSLAALLSLKETYNEISSSDAINKNILSFMKNCYIGDPQPSDNLYSDENIENLLVAINCQLDN